MKKLKHLVIAGGKGFLGTSILEYWGKEFERVTILTRQALPQKGHVHYVEWDGKNPGPWVNVINHCDLLINLTGKNVNCRYTEENKAEILRSRIDSTLALGAAVIMAEHPPKVWMNSSSATIYEGSFDYANTEEKGIIGEDFSMNICKAWEQTFFDIPTPHTRKVALRTSLVFGKNGGVFPLLKKLALLGTGAGPQIMSWIHEEDFVRALRFIADNEEAEGPINITSPHPHPFHYLMETMPHFLPLITPPKWMLNIGARLLGTETELMLKSRWVLPERLIKAGFEFKYGRIQQAIADLTSAHNKHKIAY
jgi:uncharacterized protein